MKKLNSTILTIITTCLAATAHAAKMCLGTPIVLVGSIGITCGLLLTSISVTCAASSVNVGGTISCSANVQPSNASDKSVTWSSSASGVASVDPNSGTVTGVTAGGPVTITATAVDGSNVSGTTSITVAAAGVTGTSADYCSKTVNAATLSINSILSSICSPLSTTSKFPYKECSGRNYSGYIWSATSCPLVSTTASVYGNARCSNQHDVDPSSSNTDKNYHHYDSTNGYCYRTVDYVPTDNAGSGKNCWCQLCTDITKTTCGGWVFNYVCGSASDCSSSCASDCSAYFDNYGTKYLAFRFTLCVAAP